MNSASHQDHGGHKFFPQPCFQSGAGCDPNRALTECPWSTGQTFDFVLALSLGHRDPEKPAVVSGVSDRYGASFTTAPGRSVTQLGRQASRHLGHLNTECSALSHVTHSCITYTCDVMEDPVLCLRRYPGCMSHPHGSTLSETVFG